MITREPWQIEEARNRLEEVKRKHQPALDALADAQRRLEEARGELRGARAAKKDAGKAERRIAQETLAAWEGERRERAAARGEIERRRDEARAVYNEKRDQGRKLDEQLAVLRKAQEDDRRRMRERHAEERRKLEEGQADVLGALSREKENVANEIREAALAVDDVLKKLGAARSAGVYTVSDERREARDARVAAKTEIDRLEGRVTELETEVAEREEEAAPARQAIGQAEGELHNEIVALRL